MAGHRDEEDEGVVLASRNEPLLDPERHAMLMAAQDPLLEDGKVHAAPLAPIVGCSLWMHLR